MADFHVSEGETVFRAYNKTFSETRVPRIYKSITQSFNILCHINSFHIRSIWAFEYIWSINIAILCPLYGRCIVTSFYSLFFFLKYIQIHNFDMWSTRISSYGMILSKFWIPTIKYYGFHIFAMNPFCVKSYEIP